MGPSPSRKPLVSWGKRFHNHERFCEYTSIGQKDKCFAEPLSFGRLLQDRPYSPKRGCHQRPGGL
jgi:hypothetical protein